MSIEEKFHILFNQFGKNLLIDSFETTTEWGTIHYTVAMAIKGEVIPTSQFKKDGLVAVLDQVAVSEGTLEEAIEGTFSYCHNNGLFI